MKGKRLFALVLSITSVLLMSIGFSAAYFVSDNNLYVNEIDVSLVSDPTLYIGIKDGNGNINYSTSVSTNDLGTIPVFIPVSSMYEASWLNDSASYIATPVFKEAYRTGKINRESSYKETLNATEGYFTKEIYLKASHDCYAMVSETSTFSNNPDANEKIASTLSDVYPSLTHEEIVANLNTTYKSLRYSFLYNDKDYLIYDPFKEKDTLFASPLDINADGYYDYYSSNGGRYEFLYGDYSNSDKVIYGTNEYNSSGSDFKASTFMAKTEAGVSHVDLTKSIENGLVVNKEDSISSSELKEKRHLFLLKQDEPYRVVLSIYLEGWDLDNTSLAMYGAFNVNLVFSLTEETIYG